MTPQLVTFTADGIRSEGECSQRQMFAAAEGACPSCGETDLRRTRELPFGWMTVIDWAVCDNCSWALFFCFMVLIDDAQPSLVRIVPSDFEQSTHLVPQINNSTNDLVDTIARRWIV